MAVLRGKSNDITAVREKAFGYADPVAEIAGQFQGGKAIEHGPRGPGVSKTAQPVGLVSNGYAQPLLQLEGRAVEVLGLDKAPGIGTAVGVDEQRIV